MANDTDTELLIKAKNLTAEAFAEVSKNLDRLASDQKDRNKEGEESWGKLFNTISGGVFTGQLLERGFEKALDIITDIPAKLVELGLEGSKMIGVEQAFDRLTVSAGGSVAVLDALKRGTKDTVDDFELMKIANRSLSDGMKLSAEDFGVVAQGARLLAKQTGTDTTEAFDSLNQAMATGRARALNLIGVHIDADAAQARYSATIRKSVEDFTDQDKVAANAAEVLRQLRARVADAGDQQLTFGEKVAQAATRLDDWRDEIAKAVATSPALNGAMDVINQAIDRAFGSGQQASVETVTKLIATAGVAAVKASSFIVEGAREIASAYESARGAVDQLFKAYNDAEISRVQKALDAMREVAATSTSPTSASKLRVQELEIELERLKGASQGYQEDSNAAAASQEKLNKLAQDAQEFLGQLQTQFLKTGPAAKSAGEAGAAAGQSINDGFQMASKSAAQLAEVWRKMRVAIADIETKFLRESIAKTEEANQKEAEMRGQQQTDQLKLAQEYSQKLEDLQLSGTDLEIAQIERGRKAALDAETSKANVTGWALDQSKAKVNAYYDYLTNRALGSADTIEERMRAQGIKTQADLDREAAVASRDFLQMAESGKYNAAQLQTAWTRAVDAMVASTGDWRLIVEKDLGSFTDILRSSLEGGGGLSGALKSFGAKESNDFFTTLFNPMDFDSALGSIARAIPGIGAVITPALSAVLSGIKKLFGTAGRDAVKDFAAQFNDPGLNNGFDNLQAKLEAIGRNDLWKALTQGVGRNDAEAAKKEIAAVQAALDKVNSEVEKYALTWKDLVDPGKMAAGFKDSAAALLGTFNDLKQAGYSDSAIVRQMGGDLNDLVASALSTGQKIPPALEPMLETFIRGGGLTDDLKRKLEGLGDTGPSFDDVKNAASSLGVDLDKLGPKVDQLRFTDELEADAKQLQILQDAGADMGSVYDQMKGKMQDYVTTALKEGIQLPESIRPFVNQMIAAGDLTDLLGDKLTNDSKLTWSRSINDDVEDLVKAMQDLVDVIKDGVGGALNSIGNSTYRPRIKPYIDDSDASGFVPGDQPPIFGGGGGVGLGDGSSLTAASSFAASSRAGGGAWVAAPVVLDGVKVAELQLRRQGQVLSRYRVRRG